MWEASYGKESFDLRLTVLRMVELWRLILVCTLAGTMVLGGLYCVKNILLRGETRYKAESMYRVDYSVEEKDLDKVFINDYTWNTYVHTEEFLNDVRSRLEGGRWADMTNDELAAVIQGNLESDWRLPSTIVITEAAEKSVAIARAVEETMTEAFPKGISEIDSIRVIDSGGTAEKVIPDIRVGRAFVLAAVLSLFFTLVILLLKEIGDDSIWLPATMGYRYGLKVLGTIESRELDQNLSYFYAGKKKIAVCTVQEDTNPVEVTNALERVCVNENRDEKQFLAVPAPILCPESAEVLRKADGILLAVEAGKHAGKQLEYVLEYLRQQDCGVTAVLLWNADERLLQRYYRFTQTKK